MVSSDEIEIVFPKYDFFWVKNKGRGLVENMNFREGTACRDEGVDCVPRKTECSGYKEFRVVGNCKTDQLCNSVGEALIEGDICRPYLFRYSKNSHAQ